MDYYDIGILYLNAELYSPATSHYDDNDIEVQCDICEKMPLTNSYDPYIKPSTVAEPALATMVDNMYRQCEDQSLSTMDDNIFDGMNMFM